MSLRIIAVLTLALSLSACSKKDDDTASVDADGYCTQTMVTDYNSVVRSMDNATNLLESDYSTDRQKIDALKSTQRVCNTFKARHSSAVCKARNEDSFQEETVYGYEVVEACKSVDELLDSLG